MFRETITVGRPYGIRVELSLTWLLALALLSWSLGTAFFPLRFPGWSPRLIWLSALGASFIFLASVVLHEVAHVIAARRQGVGVRSISLFLFGGVSQYRHEPSGPRAELLIGLAGPAANAFTGILALGGLLLIPDGQPAPIWLLCFWIAAVNASLAIFNLLPWLPLDGGRILQALAWFASGDRAWATRVSLLAGQLGAVGLFFAGLVMVVTQQGGLMNAIWLMLVAWFIHSSAVASYQTSTLARLLDGARVAELMVRRLGRVERESSDGEPLAPVLGTWGPEYYVVTHEGRDIGVFAMHSLQAGSEPDTERASLLDIIVPLHPNTVIAETDSALDALRLFTEQNLQWVPVVSEGAVTGVIRRLDIAEYVERNRR